MVKAMAIKIELNDLPKLRIIAKANKMVGKDQKTFINIEITASILPPKKPASPPRNNPINNDNTTEANPIISV